MFSILRTIKSALTRKEEKAHNYLFSKLPGEIRLLIAQYLRIKDLNSFLQTNRELYFLLTPVLHNLAVHDVGYAYPALCWAAKRGHEPLVKLLLEEKGADTEVRRNPNPDSFCFTPLQIAAFSGRDEIVRLLLQHGAKVEATELDKHSPLYIAALKGHCTVMKLLLEQRTGLDLLLSDPDRPKILGILTGGRRHLEALKMLLEKSADINERNPHNSNRTPLHCAVEKIHAPAIRLLMENGADIKALDDSNHTPLTMAIERGYKETVQLMVGMGAKLHDLPEGTDPVLHHTASSNHRYTDFHMSRATIDKLLELGADIEALNSFGETVLLHAIRSKMFKIACFLIERGADIFVKRKNKNQTTVLDWLVEDLGEPITKMVLDRLVCADAKRWQDTDELMVFVWAVWAGHEAMVGLLLDRGMDVINRDFEMVYQDFTMTHTHILLDLDIRFGERENVGSITLRLAQRLGHKSVARILSRRGARIEHTVEVD